MQGAAALILMYFVFPLWLVAGLADWQCHRRTGIAVTSGLKENLLHWLMYVQMAAAMFAVAFFELNAAVLAAVAGLFLLHEATVYWDLRYSTLRRDVGPWEQMVHSFIELLPLLSLVLLALVARPQALAIVRLGDEAPDWALRPGQQLFPLPYLAAAVVASVVFNVLPLAQETVSCVAARVRRSRQRAARERQHASGPPRPQGGQQPHLEPRLDTGAEPRLEPRLDPQPTARTPASPAPK